MWSMVPGRKPARGERPLLAGTVSSARLLKAAFGRRGSGIEGQLTGASVDLPSRPLPVIEVSRMTSRQWSVSGYSRHSSTAVRKGSFSKAVAHGLAALVGIGCRPQVDQPNWNCRPSAVLLCVSVSVSGSDAALAVIGARRSLQPQAAPFVPLGRPQCADFASQAFTPGCSPTARYRRRSFGQ